MVQKGASNEQQGQYEVPVETLRMAKLESVKKKISKVIKWFFGIVALYTLIYGLWGIVTGSSSFGSLVISAICLFILYMVFKVFVLYAIMKAFGWWYLTKDIAKY